MRLSSVLIVLGVVGLGVFIAFFDRAEWTTDGRREVSRRLFTGLEQATRLEIKNGGAVTSLEKRGYDWVLGNPDGAPVRPGAVDRILARLDSFRAAARVDAEELARRGIDVGELELEEANRYVEFGVAGKMRRLVLGGKSAFGNAVYARLTDEEGVFSVESELLDLLPESPSALRDTSLGMPSWKQVVKVELQRSTGLFRAEKKGSEQWRLTEPANARLDAARLEELMDSLAAASISDFVTDEPGDIGAYGFLEDAARIRWWVDGSEEPGELVLGDEVPGAEGEVFAQLDRYPTVFTVSQGVRAKVETPVNVFRDRRIVPFRPDELLGITIEREETRVELTRKPKSEWMVLCPDEEPADGEAIERLVRGWCRTPVFSFPENQNLATNDVPLLQLTFSGSNETGRLSWPVEIYKPRPSGLFVLRLPAEELLVEAPASLRDGISTETVYYRDRSITRFRADQVARVSRRMGEETVSFVHDVKANVWNLEDEDSGLLNETAFEQFLRVACSLRAQQILSFSPSSLADIGLKEPEAEVTLQLRSGDVLRETILLGKTREDGSRYGMLRGQDLVFILPNSASDVLTKRVATRF